ncbi:MAG TPA: transposase [Rickettsia endosymbiont of Bembidion lapponicum]|nr:transposase [Rickettsia endosymbiont of Bembidion lapponicum]
MGSLAHHWKQEGIEEERARSAIKIKKEKITIAKKMLTRNKPLDEIIDFTGLTEKEIEKLK